MILYAYLIIFFGQGHSLKLNDLLFGNFFSESSANLQDNSNLQEQRKVLDVISKSKISDTGTSEIENEKLTGSRGILKHPYFEGYKKNKEDLLTSLFEIGAEHQTKSGVQINTKTEIDEDSPNEIFNLFEDINFLPIIKTNQSIRVSHEDKPLLKVLDTIREGVWQQFLDSMKSKFGETKESEWSPIKTPLFKIVMQYLTKGKDLNIVHLLGKKVDSQLFKNLSIKLKDLETTTSALENILANSTNPNIANTFYSLADDVAWTTVRKIGSQLMKKVNDTVTHEDFQKYEKTLETINPLASKGLVFLVQWLKSNGTTVLSDTEYNRQGRDYGHSSGGYHHKLYIDPYLILAGIGAAALLSLIAYQIFLDQQNNQVLRSEVAEVPVASPTLLNTQTILDQLQKAALLYQNS